MAHQGGRRIIEINRDIIGPTPAKQMTVKMKKKGDFTGVDPVFIDAALKYTNPLQNGPPLCDELVALVLHMFTYEEAMVFNHVGSPMGVTALQIAKKINKDVAEVEAILDRLTVEKRFLESSGAAGKKKYKMYMLIPGVFEFCLIRPSADTLTDWHKKFSLLFEALFATGYMMDYQKTRSTPFVKYLPANSLMQVHPMALPTDKLEVILDRYKDFGIALCQCRLTAEYNGRGCGKPKLNCAVIGSEAPKMIQRGWFKRVSKNEMIEIKREAEAAGLVNWMMNVRSTKFQSSCSCCGCCCYNFRMINDYSAAGSIAPPHFIPVCDGQKCTYCGKCAMRCPMAALTIDRAAKRWTRSDMRCIGCGQCVLACDKIKAITMEVVPHYKMPYASWASLMFNAIPVRLKRSAKVWYQRWKKN
ncbi:MAG: hypothetical protein JW795_09085 [Chitinivibrionales bacterium]|nr:hypothetical protein [Chitinivibrionales bacterium]